jgi:hypothetical protein
MRAHDVDDLDHTLVDDIDEMLARAHFDRHGPTEEAVSSAAWEAICEADGAFDLSHVERELSADELVASGISGSFGPEEVSFNASPDEAIARARSERLRTEPPVCRPVVITSRRSPPRRARPREFRRTRQSRAGARGSPDREPGRDLAPSVGGRT